MPGAVADTSTKIAEKLVAEDAHYLAAVTALGDQQSVLASDDILTATGVKLIAKGTPIDSRLREKLLGYRLGQNFDQKLTVSNAVSAGSLANKVDRLITEEPFWQRLAARSGDPLAMRHGLARIALPAALAFKLTVMREHRPHLFAHSLRVAVLAHYLALRLGLDDKNTHHLLLAALCHDLGEMHTDPAILDPSHRISDAERGFVYVHPATAYVILRDIPGVAPEVARTVLHHHERLDGSGYPSGLDKSRITPLALPLMVADTAESVLHRFADRGRLSALLRLNQNKYDSRSVGFLHDAILAESNTPGHYAEKAPSDRMSQLLAFSRMLDEWTAFRRTLNATQLAPGTSGIGFLHDRLQNLNSLLYQFGFDPGSFDMLIALSQSDPQVAAELGQVFDELQYQLSEIAREIDRHGPTFDTVLTDAQQTAFSNWRTSLQETLQRPVSA